MQKSQVNVLNRGTEDELVCTGYRRSIAKTILCVLLSVITVGGLQLVFYWKPEWRLWCTSSKCVLKRATKVLLQNQYKEVCVAEVKSRPLSEATINSLHINSTPTPMPHMAQECEPDPNQVSVFYSTSTENQKDTESSDVAVLVAGGDGANNGTHSHLWSYSSMDSDEEIDDTKALINIKKKESENIFRYFEHHKLCYYWNESCDSFLRLYALEENTQCASIYSYKGYDSDQKQQRQDIYGRNVIDVEVPSYLKLFVKEVLNPFYIFQIFSIILWIMENYFVYGGCILVIIIISLGVSLYETKRQSIVLHDMVAHESTVTVCRNGTEEEINSGDVVPGDLIYIPPHGCIMSCDAALISGNCIVNESMLTGESVPVTKTPLPCPPPTEGEPPQYYSPENHKRHTLFCGTKVIQTRYYGSEKVKAVVIRTGFSTMKGDLVRSILFPKPVGFKFYSDSMKFIGILAILASIGIIYSVVILALKGAKASDIVYKALDIITVAVPPSLPAAMTVGTVYAQQRLKKGKVFCISPQRINICGKLKLVCFDKTGTLTEDSLDLWGVVPLLDRTFQPVVQAASTLPRGPFLAAMATCHSLTRIDGELVGDPLDLKMFEATDWELEEPGPDTSRFDTLIPTVVKPKTNDTLYAASTEGEEVFEIGVVRQFPFTSSLQRMCVITRTMGAKYMDIYVKGAPEMIASLSDPRTVPEDFQEVLQNYTQQGFRVLALGWRQMDPKFSWHHAQKIQRTEVECNLTFIGLLIMQNALKPVTTEIIKQLNDANIRTVMVTGDNMLTAISVARDCGMVGRKSKVIVINAHPPGADQPARIEWSYDTMPDRNSECLSSNSESYHEEIAMSVDHEKYHFAVSGKSFAVLKSHFPELIDKIVQRGTVYARMSPDQKTQLVEALQSLGYCVGMCGDGANDCGALKMAHAGISLSEAEASVASPFTSMVPDISCVPNVIREGRAALTTSFGVFKYMALYSVIQFTSVMILYWIDSNLGDWQFLYVDLVITTTVAVLMGRNEAYPKLVKQRPAGSITNPTILISIVSEILVVAVVQTTGYFLLFTQPWFTPLTPSHNPDDNILCYENSVIFLISSFQYITLAAAFSKGAPYRLPIYTNFLFLIALIVLVSTTVVMLFLPVQWSVFTNFLQLKQIAPVSLKFALIIGALVLFNILFAFIMESCVVDLPALKRAIRPLRCKKKPKNRYKLVEADLNKDPSWPPVGHTTTTNSKIFNGSINSA
ncbi:polyamine-transporting ATPase 13A3-like isoform X1 [Lytechinus pictus]|uniref:polyamine-transporting ATPase 13A3-like isoform X1 n=1 Tax=Lytechinus pictus TaxID=7653 RepID=UPI0030B9EC21